MRSRKGFALLAVVWIMMGVSVLGLIVSVAARGAVATTRNRMLSTRAGWLAEDCIERTRLAVSMALQDDDAGRSTGRPWLRLDEIVEVSPLVSECQGSVSLVPAGTRLNLNEASEDAVRRFLSWHGVASPQLDSLCDALLDWRDADNTARVYGAEREVYEQRESAPPRNDRLAHADEVSRVRGFDRLSASMLRPGDSLATLFTVEPGRVVVDRASPAVLASLPGMTEETVARLIERRLREAPPLTDLLALGSELSIPSRDSLHRHYAELVQLTTLEPDAWIVTARSPPPSGDGTAGPSVTIEVRLVRAGFRAAIVRRRINP